MVFIQDLEPENNQKKSAFLTDHHFMKSLAFLVLSLTLTSLFSQQYTIELYTKRIQDDFHKELKAPIAALGFTCVASSSANDNCVFKTLSKRQENFVLNRQIPYTYENKTDSIFAQTLCVGNFKTYDEAYLRLTKDATILSFFAKATIRRLNKQNTLEALPSKTQIDAFLVPLNAVMAEFLFFDVLHLFGIETTIVDEHGVAVISSTGEVSSRSFPFVVLWLILGSIYFTIKMDFINIKGFKHAIDLVRGKYDNEETNGEISHFQALATALSGTVGLGNIAGVAIAITIGGPGATFWMITAGLIGMSAKFVECTLGVKYRIEDKEGNVSGGPMYYLSKGFALRNWPITGKVLAGTSAIMCIGTSFGGGNMFQSNQAFLQLKGYFPSLAGNSLEFGIGFAVLVGIVIIGGIKGIAKITEKIVPAMAVIYILTAFTIFGINFSQLDDALLAIFHGAFSAPAVKGGIIGVLIIGFQRAAFSNEAGIGSASIAHAAVKTEKPITEGIVAILEPFIDTIVICTLTALVIIVTGMHDSPYGYEGAQLTSEAFGSVFPWFKLILLIAVLLFSFSTMISWSYYGLKSWTYLFGPNKLIAYLYKLIFVVFIVIGAVSPMNHVVTFTDIMLLSMAFPNIFGLIVMSGEVKADLVSYFKNLKSNTSNS